MTMYPLARSTIVMTLLRPCSVPITVSISQWPVWGLVSTSGGRSEIGRFPASGRRVVGAVALAPLLARLTQVLAELPAGSLLAPDMHVDRLVADPGADPRRAGSRRPAPGSSRGAGSVRLGPFRQRRRARCVSSSWAAAGAFTGLEGAVATVGVAVAEDLAGNGRGGPAQDSRDRRRESLRRLCAAMAYLPLR